MDSDPGPEPSINSQLSILMEGVRIYESESYLEALCAWVLAHSIYNSKFAPKKKTLGLYVQKLVLHIDDGTDVPRRALSKYRMLMG